VGSQDAKILARELDVDNVAALTDTPNFEAWVRMTENGVPFSHKLLKTTPVQWDRQGMLAAVQSRTRARYARPREKVDRAIESIFGELYT
jgi:hypothetical protein